MPAGVISSPGNVTDIVATVTAIRATIIAARIPTPSRFTHRRIRLPPIVVALRLHFSCPALSSRHRWQEQLQDRAGNLREAFSRGGHTLSSRDKTEPHQVDDLSALGIADEPLQHFDSLFLRAIYAPRDP